MKILKNSLKLLRGIELDVAEAIHFMVWKVMVYPVRSKIPKNSEFLISDIKINASFLHCTT